MRPIEDVDLSRMEIPEVSTDGHVKVVREADDGDVEILDNRTGFKPVINEDTGEVIAIHSERYGLYKNEDFVDVVKGVTGEQFEGYVQKSWNRLDIYYYPEEYRIDVDPEVGDTIRLGLRFSNSYDGSTALRTQFVGYRLQCKNGMSAKGLISDVSTKHTNKSISAEEFADIVEQMFSDTNFELLKEIFQDAKTQTIENPIEWIEALSWNNNMPNALKNAVQEELIRKDVKSISRYELWNTFTQKLTHGFGGDNPKDAHTYSETYLQRCHNKINDILTVSDLQIEETMNEIRELEEVRDRYNDLEIEVVAEP